RRHPPGQHHTRDDTPPSTDHSPTTSMIATTCSLHRGSPMKDTPSMTSKGLHQDNQRPRVTAEPSTGATVDGLTHVATHRAFQDRPEHECATAGAVSLRSVRSVAKASFCSSLPAATDHKLRVSHTAQWVQIPSI
ncbi:MAG: hypothetical protein ACXW34_06420, partial [Nitrospira sp.]